MSKKSWFGRTKKLATQDSAPTSVPRTKAEIDQKYTELCALAGQIQFRNKQAEAHLNQINQQIQSVNNEADARAKLDAEEKAKENPAETSNV